MGAYKYMKENFQAEFSSRNDALRNRIVQWRDEPSVNRIQKPTNLGRARELGYRAKQGVVVVRVRVRKGMRKREKPRGGRKPSKAGRFFSYDKSLQSIAEERASRKFLNCEVLNSYYIGEDGEYKFFEAILLDRSHPSVQNDSRYAEIISQKGRAFRGLTSAGKRHRGL